MHDSQMRGYRFFEEFIDAGRQQSAGNVIAIHMAGHSFVKEGGVCLNAVCAQIDKKEPNSPVTSTLFNAEYLGERCRSISESRARTIHPRLFEYLESLA
ncbi:MAG: hypothetical protein ACREON_15040 [Gemmatimonadaceae bacterium]